MSVNQILHRCITLESVLIMKTDSDLQRDVLDELEYEPSLEAQAIGVTVREGVVTLTGHVQTYVDKYTAETAAKRVAGVRGIAEELTVSLFSGHERNDSDIAQAAVNALDWNVNVPLHKVQATVENGWITLNGYINWNYQRDAAFNAVSHLMGVKGVSNLIGVKPLPTPSVSTVEIKQKIEAALKRNMMKDVDGITVEAKEGKIKLHGKVQSWEEHDDAALAAWSAPGVTAVENDIQVTY